MPVGKADNVAGSLSQVSILDAGVDETLTFNANCMGTDVNVPASGIHDIRYLQVGLVNPSKFCRIARGQL